MEGWHHSVLYIANKCFDKPFIGLSKRWGSYCDHNVMHALPFLTYLPANLPFFYPLRCDTLAHTTNSQSVTIPTFTLSTHHASRTAAHKSFQANCYPCRRVLQCYRHG